MSDIINSSAKKASDSKSQESKRATPPKITGGQRVGPNIIEKKQQIIEERAQLDEPLTNENIHPFLLNKIIDNNTGEVDIKELIHGIEVLENKVNAIT